MKYYGFSSKEYILEEYCFAQGGEGKIFNVIDHDDVVAKLYKENKCDKEKCEKIRAMVMNPPSADSLVSVAWPLDGLFDADGRFAGFIMKKMAKNVDLNAVYEYGPTATFKDLQWSKKIVLAKNLCAGLAGIHDAGHVVGDLNPKNISVDPQTGRVTFFDTDSFHISDRKGNVYRCGVGMAGYLSKEVQDKMKNGGLSSCPLPTFTKDSDNFALAIHIFQILMNGAHPFTAAFDSSLNSDEFTTQVDNIQNGVVPFINPTKGMTIPKYAPEIHILPQNIINLFKLAFIDGTRDPSLRPTPVTWFNELSKLQEKGQLVNCRKNENHVFYKECYGCPWCKTDAIYNSSFVPRKIATSSTVSGENKVRQVSSNTTKSSVSQTNVSIATRNSKNKTQNKPRHRSQPVMRNGNGIIIYPVLRGTKHLNPKLNRTLFIICAILIASSFVAGQLIYLFPKFYNPFAITFGYINKNALVYRIVVGVLGVFGFIQIAYLIKCNIEAFKEGDWVYGIIQAFIICVAYAFFTIGVEIALILKLTKIISHEKNREYILTFQKEISIGFTYYVLLAVDAMIFRNNNVFLIPELLIKLFSGQEYSITSLYIVEGLIIGVGVLLYICGKKIIKNYARENLTRTKLYVTCAMIIPILVLVLFVAPLISLFLLLFFMFLSFVENEKALIVESAVGIVVLYVLFIVAIQFVQVL